MTVFLVVTVFCNSVTVFVVSVTVFLYISDSISVKFGNKCNHCQTVEVSGVLPSRKYVCTKYVQSNMNSEQEHAITVNMNSDITVTSQL